MLGYVLSNSNYVSILKGVTNSVLACENNETNVKDTRGL